MGELRHHGRPDGASLPAWTLSVIPLSLSSRAFSVLGASKQQHLPMITDIYLAQEEYCTSSVSGVEKRLFPRLTLASEQAYKMTHWNFFQTLNIRQKDHFVFGGVLGMSSK